MNHPPTVPSPRDPLPDADLENRLRQAAPALPDSALMERLRRARPVISPESLPAAATPGSRPPASAASRRNRRTLLLFLKPLTAAALVACAWAGWRAAVPGRGGSPAHPAAAIPEKPRDADPELEFLPSLESRQHLLNVRELGVIRDSRQRPVQLMSATWLDENTYGGSPADPALRESRLRHEIVPVLLPTY